jgi:hypothetical protein
MPRARGLSDLAPFKTGEIRPSLAGFSENTPVFEDFDGWKSQIARHTSAMSRVTSPMYAVQSSM